MGMFYSEGGQDVRKKSDRVALCPRIYAIRERACYRPQLGALDRLYVARTQFQTMQRIL